ncbi:MAG: major facilitator superfamily 1 [Bacteroidetes bacterium]|jgi:maltose/moltooligosaccharide transporter|nr:major facilitator superfamily 1 [Bacteroidota bacterium]
MRQKPHLNFWQLWNMSFGYLGIQFGFALQNANVSRIFETLGAQVDKIPILWIAGPITGLIVHPIVGHMSDKTWNRLGRRKPYFLVGAILASLSLLVMPNSPYLWFAAGMLWIMDASINTCMQPFRAFIGDMLPEDQQTKGFAVQTFFIGASSIVASVLPYILANWFGVANTAPEGEIPASVKWSFYLGGIVFILAVLWTIIRTKEYSPGEMEEFSAKTKESEEKENAQMNINTRSYNTQGLILLGSGAVFTFLTYILKLYPGLYILTAVLIVYGILQIIAAKRSSSGKNGGMVEIIHDMKNMPPVMKKLAWVQMFTWFGLFSMFIYCTQAVTSFHYGSTDPKSVLYNEGANWVGVLMAVYNGVAALIVFLIPPVSKRIGRVLTHSISLVIGGLGLASWYVFKDPKLLILSMTCIGVAWASLLTIPYAILAGSLPQKKMGIYMGIFNFFIVIPQIVASAILGLLVKSVFGEQSIYALVLGGGTMIIAGILMLFVKDTYDKA